jgi:hypothetical protein
MNLWIPFNRLQCNRKDADDSYLTSHRLNEWLRKRALLTKFVSKMSIFVLSASRSSFQFFHFISGRVSLLVQERECVPSHLSMTVPSHFEEENAQF